MLVQGPVPDLGGVGLGVEAEADLPADARASESGPRPVRTNVPPLRPRLVITYPEACSRCSASRTVVRLTAGRGGYAVRRA
jgi:hypothetical protein